jgi:hypothetical protein
MVKSKNWILASLSVASIAIPIYARAASDNLSCSVVIDHTLTQSGTVLATESYQKTFIAQTGVNFVDDFSTNTRTKEFTATTLRQSGKTIVGIGYFNDVGTFNTIQFDTTLTILNDQPTETVSGGQSFFTSLSPLNGEHRTNYTLTCRRAK